VRHQVGGGHRPSLVIHLQVAVRTRLLGQCQRVLDQPQSGFLAGVVELPGLVGGGVVVECALGPGTHAGDPIDCWGTSERLLQRPARGCYDQRVCRWDETDSARKLAAPGVIDTSDPAPYSVVVFRDPDNIQLELIHQPG
jgi:hypothetical protein